MIDILNNTYNASEFQAWRSGRALRHLLEETSARGATHLLVHSQGNVVAAEALRQHAETSDSQLVANYVAMEAAISAGVYGLDGTSAFLESGILESNQDLYRHWYAGNNAAPGDGPSDIFPDQPLMAGAGSAAGKWTNFYNIEDAATNLAWTANNSNKLLTSWNGPVPGVNLPPADIWAYRYIVEQAPLPDGTVENLYYRHLNILNSAGFASEVPRSEWTQLHPATDRYEILGFASVANAQTLGTVDTPLGPFSAIVDIGDFVIDEYAQLDDRSTHSYQFYHDYYATREFWDAIKTATDFENTN